MNILFIVLSIIFSLACFVWSGIYFYTISKKTFFCAFPRIAAYGNPNRIRYIHLKGFLFIISNDIWCKDIVYQNEAVNMAFQYNLKPQLIPSEVLNNKKPLNIEMLDMKTGDNLSYSVPHSNKFKAIMFFKSYKELMDRVYAHTKKQNND